MAETKVCEQCQREQDIECFYRRPNKNDPNKRIKICIDCYKQNFADNKRQWEERHRQLEEQQKQRQAEQEAERLTRKREQQAQLTRALELSIQANKRCPRCKQVRTDGRLWVRSNGEEHLYFPRVCQACTDATPYKIYRLICPLFNQIRYVGITSQPLERRLGDVVE